MRIACIGDIHYTSMAFRGKKHREMNRTFYRRFLETFFAVDADYYVILGDLTHFGTHRQLREIREIIEGAKRPEQHLEIVIGNHDILFGQKEPFRRIMGLDHLFRSFDAEGVRLIFLDTARVASFRKNSSLMGIEQSRWFSSQLLEAGERPVMVFAHHPADDVRMTDQEGRYLPHLSVKSVLALKEGRGIYVNGHKHKDHFSVEQNWAFLQFNDILDEMTIRILNYDEGKFSMESVTIDDPWMVKATDRIARLLFTFVKKKNDVSFADVGDLTLEQTDDESFRMDMATKPFCATDTR
ncbi:MAG: metallophosphoesterase [Peptoniphilaceae bacterium]|nr:metallophosphoesterase [Peptoniphilaceae bacterium]MDY6086265.1 metallophosphoesterase [Peptoniphilaceae bacterium]